MTLIVDGVDLTPYVAFNGLKWSRNDVDGPNAGRTLDGQMQRDRVATKIRLDVTFKPLTDSEIAIVMAALEPEYISCTYTDPMFGLRTMEAYSNNHPATALIERPNGEWLWNEITAPIIER